MPTTIVWDTSHSCNSVKNTPVRNRVAEVFSGCGAQSFHLQVNRTVATVQKDLIARRRTKFHRNPTTAPRVFGSKRHLMRRDVYRHILRGLQLHHMPIALTVHDQNIRHTQRGPRLQPRGRPIRAVVSNGFLQRLPEAGFTLFLRLRLRFQYDPNTPNTCLLYTSPSPRDRQKSRMPSSA